MTRVWRQLSPVAVAVLASACGASKGDPGDVGGSQYAWLESAATTTASEAAVGRRAHALQTVFVILLENHNWSQIEGSASAPFINRTLLPAGAHTTQYLDNVKAVHPSEPNYVWIEAGDNLAITDDDEPDVNHRTTKAHLVTQLEAAGIDWRSYQEGISGAECPLEPAGRYNPKHNPMLFFDDVNGGDSAASSRCIAHVRPFGELSRDLATGHVAAYNFITPDLCNDMHDACASGDPIANGDAWLAANVPVILQSDAFRRGGALFITWDESEGDREVPIGMIALSPFAKPGYVATARYTHSSLLRTIQDVLAVRPYLRDAANAADLGDLFTTYP